MLKPSHTDEVLEIEHNGAQMTIAYRWPIEASATGLMGGALFLASSIFAIRALHNGFVAGGFAMAGLCLLYIGLKLLLNKTTIAADPSHVSVSSGPIFVGRPRTFLTEGVLEFFVASPLHTKQPLVEPRPTIFLVDADKTPHRLIDAVPSKEAADQIRHALLDFYGLEDLESAGRVNLPMHKGPT